MALGKLSFQVLLERWFSTWLIGHLNLSKNTIDSYRDTFRLLFRWLTSVKGIYPDRVKFSDIDRGDLLIFADYLASERSCSSKTINCRINAIRAFATYVSTESPEHVAWATGIRSIKQRRETAPVIGYLMPDEIVLLTDSCDEETIDGQRDSMMIQLLFNSGFRASELIAIKVSDVEFDSFDTCRIEVLGKGRKKRTIPLWASTTSAIKSYVTEAGLSDKDFLFRGRNVEHLTRSGLGSRIKSIIERASRSNTSIAARHITAHTLRHSTAMAMLDAGIDISTIAIWLGHEDIKTTHKYMVSSIEMKQKALERASVSNPFTNSTGSKKRYEADSKIMAFLENL